MVKKAKTKDSDSEELSGSEMPSNCKLKQRPILDFKIIIVQDEADSKEYCWNKLWAGTSKPSRRKFCIICGCPASYTCVNCSKHKPIGFERNFCSIRCQNLHNDTDCGKPIDMTRW